LSWEFQKVDGRGLKILKILKNVMVCLDSIQSLLLHLY